MTTIEFVDKIADSAATYPIDTFSNRGRIYTCVNPYSYHLVKKYSDLYCAMDGLFVDGMTMCWLIRILWKKYIPRLSFDMSGMAADLFQYLDNHERRENIYFIGTKQDIIENTIKQFRNAYPNMKIAGYRNGYFKDADERYSIITDIVNLNSDYVIVGMGAPLQEQFALDLKSAGYKGIVFTCGGFLHQTSQRLYYYPNWVDKYNLRAFYRLYKEQGLFKRLYNVLIEFPILFVFDTIKSRIL